MKTTNCTFGILGDSYSTFKGWIPEGNRRYYPFTEEVADVLTVEQTWWHLLMQKRGLQLVINDSYSGATVCEDVRVGYPPESAFTARAVRSFSARAEKLQYIFLFGCTNDDWFGKTPGQLQFENWTAEDLQRILPAYCYVLNHLAKENPETHIIVIINTGLSQSLADSMMQAAQHYGAHIVALHHIDKQNGHPTALGMTQIADQVDRALDLI